MSLGGVPLEQTVPRRCRNVRGVQGGNINESNVLRRCVCVFVCVKVKMVKVKKVKVKKVNVKKVKVKKVKVKKVKVKQVKAQSGFWVSGALSGLMVSGALSGFLVSPSQTALDLQIKQREDNIK